MTPPVEKLSDVGWARVERGIFARIDEAAPVHRRARWPWLAIPLAAAIALAIAVWPRGGGEPPIEPAPVAASRFTTGDAPSVASFDDVHVELAAQTALVRSGPVLLERGSAWFTVAPRDGRPAFVVIAGDATVRVIGTRFRVARDGERVEVDVDHGVVEVVWRGTAARVAAGEHWSSDPPAAAPPPPDAPAPPPPPPAAPRVDDRATFERLSALERRDPDAAIAGYLGIARGNGAWAEVSLFAAARLSADRHDPRAAELLARYLRRFPRGTNRADAERLLANLPGAHP